MYPTSTLYSRLCLDISNKRTGDWPATAKMAFRSYSFVFLGIFPIWVLIQKTTGMCKKILFFGVVVVVCVWGGERDIIYRAKGGGMMMGGVKNVFTDSLRPSGRAPGETIPVCTFADAYARK